MEVESAAPAQTEAPAPVLTAIESAVVADNLPAFKEARLAERTTPKTAPAPALTAVEPPAPTTAAPAQPTLNSKERKQQEINDRIRVGVAQAVAERDAEIARLRAQVAPAAPRSEPTPVETFPAYAEYLNTHPDSSLEDYIDARQDWRDTVKTRKAAAERSQTEQVTARETQQAQTKERTEAARKADPALDATFKTWEADPTTAPPILFVKTREQAIEAQQIPRPENDFASALVASEFAPQILHYLDQHPEVMDAIAALPTPRAVHMFVGKLETRFEKAPVASPPNTLTNAPALGTTLGSRSAAPADPIAAAIKADDLPAFKQARLAARVAGQRR